MLALATHAGEETVKPIRVAAQLHPQHGDLPALRGAAVQAEELGYDALYTWDHFSPLYGKGSGQHYECWTLLASWAEATSRIALGPLVACNSYRNPDLLADMARTVDHISGGRLTLGLGAGWFERDYREYGFVFPDAVARLRQLGESLPRIRHRLQVLNPPPLGTMPLLIAGGGEQLTTRLVARYADAWHVGFPDRPDEVLPKVAALRRWCAEIGRDANDIEWAVGVEPYDLDRFLERDFETYLEIGFTQFTLGFNGPDWQVAQGQLWLNRRDAINAQRSRQPVRPRASA